MLPSSRGLGHIPFTDAAGVRIPLGVFFYFRGLVVVYFDVHNRRYTGSKASLSEWIVSLIVDNCTGESFADLFAGTGVISAKVTPFFPKVIMNDLLYSNQIIYNAFFKQGSWDITKLEEQKAFYNNLNVENVPENYFSNHFGFKFFNYQDAKKIGFIREHIESIKHNLTTKEYLILIASLIYSADKVSNTVGHYDAYFRNKDLISKFEFNLIQVQDISDIEIYRQDANSLIENIKTDVAYIDPPYNSRQYSRFYHVLENLAQWNKPELHGVALKPKAENMSDYCRSTAPIVFQNLINRLQCSYIVVSYNNTYFSKSNSSRNKITLEEIQSVLSLKGETQVYERSHKYFNSGKTDFNNHKELLFITRVNKSL
jgi:adenine-specific DNA-methyltransferase